MAQETQYTAGTKIATCTTAGTKQLVVTGASNGTLLKTAHLKAQAGNTKRNMIRFYIYDGVSVYATLREVDMLPESAASINPSFEATVELNFMLKSGYSLYAAVDQDIVGGASNPLNIITEVLDISYYSAAVREDTTQFTANTGIANDGTANGSLTGSGTLPTVYTAGGSGTYKGSSIETITIKASVTNTPGMVRLFVYDTTKAYLLTEVPIPSIVPDSTDMTFEHTIIYENSFDLQAGYSIKVGTQNAENFNIMVEGKDWNYAS